MNAYTDFFVTNQKFDEFIVHLNQGIGQFYNISFNQVDTPQTDPNWIISYFYPNRPISAKIELIHIILTKICIG